MILCSLTVYVANAHLDFNQLLLLSSALTFVRWLGLQRCPYLGYRSYDNLKIALKDNNDNGMLSRITRFTPFWIMLGIQLHGSSMLAMGMLWSEDAYKETIVLLLWASVVCAAYLILVYSLCYLFLTREIACTSTIRVAISLYSAMFLLLRANATLQWRETAVLLLCARHEMTDAMLNIRLYV